jgi:predicted GIY-YIG superfamily endonuclease
METMYLYVLLLEREKYYVGMAEDIGLRLWEHFKMGNKTGSGWTKRFHPVAVVHCSRHVGTMQDFKYIEQQCTLRLAKLKGFRDVRGGGFSLTTDDYPESWDESLAHVAQADMSLMMPLSRLDLNQMMLGKYHLWLQRRRDGIKKRKTKSQLDRQE